MKTSIRIQTLLLSLLSLSLTLLAVNAADAAKPKIIFVGLADGFSPDAAAKAQDAVVRLLLESPPGTEIIVDDAVSMTSVAGPVVIAKLQFDSPAARAHQLARALLAVKQRFTNSTTNSPGSGWLRVPEYLDFVAQRAAGENVVVLLLGSPLAHYPAEESFTMTFDPPRVPSDGNITAPSDESPYSTVRRVGQLHGVVVGWWHEDGRWFASDLHHDKLQSWWGKFIGAQGAELRAFSSDLNTTIALTLANTPSALPKYQPDPSDSKVTMQVVLPRLVPVQVPVLAPPVIAPVPIVQPESAATSTDGRTPVSVPISPAVQLVAQPIAAPARSEVIPVAPPPGRSAIGIAWLNGGKPVDLDLYVKPTPSSQELSFRLTATKDGIYTFDDRRGSAGNIHAFEYVELKDEADPTKIRAWVNFYAGKKSPMEGRVVVFYRGRVCEADFRIQATSGNSGSDSSRRESSPYWVEIPVGEMMK